MIILIQQDIKIKIAESNLSEAEKKLLKYDVVILFKYLFDAGA